MIQKIKINEVKENPSNPRTIKENKFKKLVKSIQDFPRMLEIRPIVVDENMIVLGGNMRLKACKAAGLTEVHIIKVDDLTPDQQKEFVVKDNLGYGEWDWDVLLSDEWGFELVDSWGIDFPEAKKPKPEAKEDNYTIPDKLVSTIQLGDLIEIGPHRLLCGSAIDPADMDKLMNGRSADMAHTDPPYNVDYEGGNGLKIMNDKMSDSKFYGFLLDFYRQMERVLKPGGPCYIWHADSEILNFKHAMDDAGFHYSATMHWVKSNFTFGRADYHHRTEPALYGWKPGAAHCWYGDRTQSTVYDQGDARDFEKMTKAQLLEIVQGIMETRPNTNVVRVDKPSRNIEHPTMKPILLCAYYIGNSSQPNDIVLDQFLGSGSTMVASHQLNRVCYGTELDPHYCQVIIDRMQKLDPSLTVKINGSNRVL